MMGDEFPQRAIDNTTPLTRPYQELLIGFTFGEVWKRDVLSRAERSLVTLSFLIALNRPDQMRTHIRAALNNGVPKEKIFELAIHALAYLGAPLAGTARNAIGEKMSDAKPRLGFVGLGNMGGPMANNLVKGGYSVSGFDLNRQLLLKRAQEIGLHAADSAADAAKRSDYVITMLPNGQNVREAVFGKGGIVEGLAKGGIVIDMSSAGATGTAQLGKELTAKGFTLIDAPVSGGVTGAEAGTLAIMVGGDDNAAIDKIWPVLEAMGKKLFRAGKLGSGHAAKSINNYLGATNLIAIAEGLIAGTKFGLDPANLLAIINASTG